MSNDQPINYSQQTGDSHEVSTQKAPSRILIVLPNWVGDLVLATPALRVMRERFRDTHIAFLLRSHLEDILSGGQWADEIIHWPATTKGQSRPKRRQGFLGFAAEMRDRRFDWAVLFSNSFRAALLARLAGIRSRIGYDRDGRGLLLTDRLLPERYNGKYVPIPMTRYYNAIARYLGCRNCSDHPELYTTPEEEAVVDGLFAAAGVTQGRPVVVLNPGSSFGPAKRWLPERFAEVADRLVVEHGAAMFIACGPKEIDTARQVAGHMRHSSTVLDKPVLPLGPTKALIRRAGLLITNDTGPRHFGIAFRVPTVTIFGPTHQQWTATNSSCERAIQVPVDCGPCMKRKCPLDHRCMRRVTGDMVVQAARELLSRRTQPVAT
ncbi:MAG TPA: lipopolysaccharide heptosyltransferase II [Phycisphaerae bacterium]|nr:lipopolysaccharide heptosyltransferase II [Phycisphaerae bacterium]